MNETEKALGRSISFFPSSLYTWAQEYGDKQEPKQSVSAVICTALREYKERHEPSDRIESEVLRAAKRIGMKAALSILASNHRPSRRKAA